MAAGGQPIPVPPTIVAINDIPPPNDMSTILLTTKEVAAMLRVSQRCLERYRTTGEGPRFVRLSANAVRYRAADVTAFIAARTRDNTAQ